MTTMGFLRRILTPLPTLAPSDEPATVPAAEPVAVPTPPGEAPSTHAWAKAKDRQRQPKSCGDLTRYEMKYWIPRTLVPIIRGFIQPFCLPDKHAKGDPPGYINTTLQFDTPTRGFYAARGGDAYSRFKLRARVYATDGSCPVILEIKRKIGANIIKSRARIPFDRFDERCGMAVDESLTFKNEEEWHGYREFVRLRNETGALPVLLVRYRREPWFSVLDDYARVTFDSQLVYQPTRSWTQWGRGSRWRPMDFGGGPYGGSYSGTVLELKSAGRVPMWMQELVTRFELERRAVCKYAIALETERNVLPGDLADDWLL